MENSILNEFWIVNNSGITVFHDSQKNKEQAQVFGGFVVALNQFSKEISKNQFKAIQIGNSKINFYHTDYDYIFVGYSDSDIKEKKIIELLSKADKYFYQRYGKTLKDWDGDNSIFKEIEEEFSIEKVNSEEFGFKLDKKTAKSILNRL